MFLSQLMVKICYDEIWSFVALRVYARVCACASMHGLRSMNAAPPKKQVVLQVEAAQQQSSGGTKENAFPVLLSTSSFHADKVNALYTCPYNNPAGMPEMFCLWLLLSGTSIGKEHAEEAQINQLIKTTSAFLCLRLNSDIYLLQNYIRR